MKRNKNGPKRRRRQETVKPTLLIMAVLLITVLTSVAAYAQPIGRTDMDAGAGSMNYYQQELAEKGVLGSVGPDGQASYSYQIGLVSLNYSSGSDWSVGGYSVIARSTKKGVPKYNDAPGSAEIYELDGEELIEIGTGSDTPNGFYREFRTKRESFQRVLFYCQRPAAELFWKIFKPDGSQAVYSENMYAQGGNSDLHQGLPRAWGISTLSGRGGYDFTYYKYRTYEDAPGAYYLHKVISGKAQASSINGLTGTILTWRPNTDYQKKYSFRTGSRVLIDGYILDKVETYMGTNVTGNVDTNGGLVPGQLAEGCRIEYYENQQAPGAIAVRKRKPLIKKIFRYGNNPEECRRPVTFTYHNINLAIAPETEKIVHQQMDNREIRASDVIGSHDNHTYGYYADFMDVNGDGLPDRVYQETGSGMLQIWLNNEEQFIRQGDIITDNYALRRTPLSSNTYRTTQDYFDINGDGFPDRVSKELNQPFKVRLGNGSSFGPETTWSGGKIDGGIYIRNHIYMDTYADFIDMNGDGLPDQVVWERGSVFTLMNIYFNTGSGLATTPTYWAPNLPVWDQYDFDYYRLRHIETTAEHPSVDEKGSNISGQLMDMNGDGLPDYVVKHTALQHHNYEYEEADLEDHSKLIVCYNNGRGFEEPVQWNATDNACLSDMGEVGAVWISGDSWDYMDMNNDGLPDRVAKNIIETITYSGGVMTIYHEHMPLQIWFNNGNGFDRRQDYADTGQYMLRHDMLCSAVGLPNEVEYTGVLADFMDIDGDGFPDRVMKAPERVLILQGDYLAKLMQLPNTNGDLYVYPNKAAAYGPPDLLESIDNGQGGKTIYGYQPIDKTLNPHCQPTMWVVTSVKVLDGLGNTERTTYEYRNGVYDALEHEFRGFGEVTVTEPTGNCSVTNYYTDPDRKGLVNCVNYLKPGENGSSAINSTGYTYNEPVFTVSGNNQIKFISLAQKLDTIYGTAGEDIVTEYQYDQYGNVTKTVETESYNDDKRITQNWYNTTATGSNWNLRELKESTVVGYDISRVFRLQDAVYHLYDSDGNLTHTYKWLEGTTPYPVGGDGTIATRPSGSDSRWVLQERRYYDSYGNVNQVKDARGNSTYTTYDTKYGVFPVRTVNALNYTTWDHYDYYGSEYDVATISQRITLGRPTKTVFQNTGLYTSQYYDSFGRVVKKVRMDYSEQYPTEEIVYTDATVGTDGLIATPASVALKQRPLPGVEGTDNQLLCSYTYTDGRGRTIQTKSSHGDGQYSTVSTRYYIIDDKTETHIDMPILTATPNFTPGVSGQSTFTSSRYDADQGWVSTITGSDWSVTTTVKNVWTTTVTDPLNNVAKSYGNGFGQTLRVIEPDEAMTEYFYETGSGNLVELNDHSGNKTRFVYDTLGRKVKEIDPDLGTTTYTYDANNNPISKTDANGQTISYEYDVLNRLTAVTYPGTGNIDNFIYENNNFEYNTGKLTHTYIYRNNVCREERQLWYDQYGNMAGEYHWIDGKHAGMTYQYDGLGRETAATYPGDDVFLYKYHPSGAGIKSIIMPTGMTIVSGTQYSPSGKISQMNLNGAHPFSINYEYFEYNHPGADMLKRISTTQGVAGFDLNYRYDGNGNVTQIIDGLIPNNSQSFSYDSRNRLVQADGNDMYGLKYYDYNQLGNMTSKEGKILNYNPGQTQRGSKPHAVKDVRGPAGEMLYIYKYDAAGNMVEKRSSGYLQESLLYIPLEVLSYDIYGLEQVTLNGQVELKTANGSYGAVGSRGQVQLGQSAKTGAITATGNVVLQDSSGVYGDIETVGSVSAGSGVFMGGITYNQTWVSTPDIQIMNNINFSGVTQTTTSVASGQSATLAPGKYWNYNVSGNLNLTSGVYYFNSLQMHTGSKLNLNDTAGSVRIYVQTTLRMKAGTFHSPAGKNGTKSLLIGYLGTQDVYLGGSAAFGGTVLAPLAKLIAGDGTNKVFEGMFIGKQVSFAADSQITCVPFIELTPEIWHYKYDWNNKLAEVQHNYNTIMTSLYGAGGDRIKKTESGTGALTIDTYYYFPGYEEDWNGSTLAGSAKYLFANGKRVAKKNAAGEFFYYVGDHLGSNSFVLDSNLGVVKFMKYLPYGELAQEYTLQEENYRFNDKERDATGLYYYGARFYDPSLGRFITADTVYPGGGFDPQGLNRYSYCLNNPVMYIDPSGHEPYGFSVTAALNTFEDAADSYYSGLDTSFWLGNETLGKIQAHYVMSDIWGNAEGYMVDFGGGYSNTFGFPIFESSNSISLSVSTGFERNITHAQCDGESMNSRTSTNTAKLEAGITHKLAGKNQLTAKATGNFKSEIEDGKRKLSYGPGINLSAKVSLPNKISVAASSGIGLNWSIKSPQPPALKTELSIISGSIGLQNGLTMKGGYKHFIQEKMVKGSPVNFNYGRISLGASLKLSHVTYSLGGQFTIYGAEPKAFEKPWGIYSGLEW